LVRTRPPGAAGVDVAESDDIGIPKAAPAGVTAEPQEQYGFAGWIVG
jgi:hypothetical protein